jgi:hypothetical protein
LLCCRLQLLGAIKGWFEGQFLNSGVALKALCSCD